MRELKRIAIAATVLVQTAVIAQTSSVSSIYIQKNGIGSAGIEKPVLSPKEQLEENIEKMKKDPLLQCNLGFCSLRYQKERSHHRL